MISRVLNKEEKGKMNKSCLSYDVSTEMNILA